jgi:8-oxo-dGTP pyrophosphatase MutT (NUDIX family)
MEITCGIYLYSTNVDMILVGHVTNQNAWSIPKGRLENSDDGYFDCAIRELWEETNISLSDVNVLEKYEFDFIKYRHGEKKIKTYLIITNTPIENFNIKCNSFFNENGIKYPEFDVFEWIKIDSLKNYVHYAQYQNINNIKSLIY